MAQSAKRKPKTDHHAKRTRDHKTIRQWAEHRGGRPSLVEETKILRFDFQEPDTSLKEVSWDEFFRIFDDRDLEFLYQDHTEDGHLSRFFKFVRSGRDE